MGGKITWSEAVVISVVATVVFVVLSYSPLKRPYNVTIYAAAMFVLMMSVKLGPSMNESFFFEASPYRKCQFNGFHGRPLQFEYSLAEPAQQCNPF